MLVVVILRIIYGSDPLSKLVDPVSTSAQSDFPQRSQILYTEKVDQSSLCLVVPIYFACIEPVDQILRLDVHQFHLMSVVKNRIGNPLLYRNTSNGRDHIVEALNMPVSYTHL